MSSQAEFQESAKTKDVEHLWMTFKNKVHSLMESHIPSKILRGDRIQKPWVSRQVKTLMHKPKKQFQKQQKTKKAKDIRQYIETKVRLHKAERQSYWQYVDNLMQIWDPDQQHQPKQKRFWSNIKSLPKDTGDVAPLKDKRDFMPTPRRKLTYWIGSMSRHGQERTKLAYQYQMAILFPSMKNIQVTNVASQSYFKSWIQEKPLDLSFYLPEHWRNLLGSYHLTCQQSSREVSIQELYQKTGGQQTLQPFFRKGRSSRPATIDLFLSPVYAIR